MSTVRPARSSGGLKVVTRAWLQGSASPLCTWLRTYTPGRGSFPLAAFGRALETLGSK